MHRVLVALLAAFDAAIAAAVGLVVVLAPLTLLWVAGLGAASWSALWPATGAVWQAGHLVALSVRLPIEYVSTAGIPQEAASFSVSLAPLALAGLTALLAARSGARAGRSGHGTVGVVSGAVVFALASLLVAATSRTPFAVTATWQAVLLPLAVFVVPAAISAMAVSWREAEGVWARLRSRLTDLPGLWPEVPALALRGAGTALIVLCGLGALAVLVALVARGGQVVALYQAGNMDAAGVVVVSLAQLAYLPTLVIWGVSFLAGPGIAVGLDTAVSPAGTQLGVVPGIPILGLLPESVSPLLLAVILLPVGAGGVAGWLLRARLRTLSLNPGYGVRAVLVAGTALLSAAGAGVLAALASGALGPGRLVDVGPDAAPVAAAVGCEVLVGAAALLLGPDRARNALPLRGETAGALIGAPSGARRADPAAIERADATVPVNRIDQDATDTVPIDPGFLGDGVD